MTAEMDLFEARREVKRAEAYPEARRDAEEARRRLAELEASKGVAYGPPSGSIFCLSPQGLKGGA
jgi:hypothetical protein